MSFNIAGFCHNNGKYFKKWRSKQNMKINLLQSLKSEINHFMYRNNVFFEHTGPVMSFKILVDNILIFCKRIERKEEREKQKFLAQIFLSNSCRWKICEVFQFFIFIVIESRTVGIQTGFLRFEKERKKIYISAM